MSLPSTSMQTSPATTRSPGRLERTVERLWAACRVDRLVGGRHHGVLAREDMRSNPRTVKAFAAIRWLLLAETLVGVTALVTSSILTACGFPVPLVVWLRAAVVLPLTLSLYVFAWRAQLGYYWAYSRLRLFSRVFPVVTLAIASIPGLYPFWMVIEQIVFSLLMVGIAEVLTTPHMRRVFASGIGWNRAAG